MRHIETDGDTKHERKTPAPPLLFVPGITNMQQLAATIEEVVNRLNYTLQIINNDTIKIKTNRLEYLKTTIHILKEKKFNLQTYLPRQQHVYRAVIRNIHHSVQQEVMIEYTE
jgi:precorrin-2 methylase